MNERCISRKQGLFLLTKTMKKEEREHGTESAHEVSCFFFVCFVRMPQAQTGRDRQLVLSVSKEDGNECLRDCAVVAFSLFRSLSQIKWGQTSLSRQDLLFPVCGMTSECQP